MQLDATLQIGIDCHDCMCHGVSLMKLPVQGTGEFTQANAINWSENSYFEKKIIMSLLLIFACINNAKNYHLILVQD